MDDSLGGLVSYTYDARNELTNETLSGSGISAEAVKNTYDNAGNMTGQTRYSNLAETTVVASTAYTYDDAELMTGITDKNSGGTTLVSYAYTYDAAELVSQEVRVWDSGSDTDTMTYDYTNNDQLTSVSHSDGSFSNESFHLGCQRQRDRHGLHHGHGQRANRLAGLLVYLRRRRQHDHDDADVDGRRLDVFVQLPKPHDRRGGEDLRRHDPGAGDIHIRRSGQSDRHGRKWNADVDAL